MPSLFRSVLLLLALAEFLAPCSLLAAGKLILKPVWTGDPKLGIHEIAIQVVDSTGDLIRNTIDKPGSSGAKDAGCFTLLGRKGQEVITPKLTISGATGTQIFLTPALPAQFDKYKFFLIIKAGCVKLTQPVDNRYENTELELKTADLVRNEKFFHPYPETKLAILQGDQAGAFSAQYHYRHPLDSAADALIHASLTADGSLLRDEQKHYLNRLETELGGYWTHDLKDSGLVEFGLSSKFQADRDFTTVDETFGLSLWSWVPWFDGLARALFITGEDTRPPFQNQPLFVVGYDYVAHLKRSDAMNQYDGNHRLYGRLYWPIPIARQVPMLVVDRKFGLDPLIDVAAIYDVEGGRIAPESKVSLDFLLDDNPDKHPSITVSYVNGRVAPRFENFNAVLAGLKYNF